MITGVRTVTSRNDDERLAGQTIIFALWHSPGFFAVPPQRGGLVFVMVAEWWRDWETI